MVLCIVDSLAAGSGLWSSLTLLMAAAALLLGLFARAWHCWRQRSLSDSGAAKRKPARFQRSATCCYTLSGAAFGFCFPMIATFLASYLGTGTIDWGGVLHVQRTRPLLWIIDSAPFWLGLFASFAGQRQDRLQEANRQLEEVLKRRRRTEQHLRHAKKQADAARLEAEAAQEEAEQAARLKHALLNNVSHELRTPLSGIIGFAEVLEEEVPGPQREFAGLIVRSGQRLQRTIESVLDMAQIESGTLQLRVEPVDVRTEVEEVSSLLQPLAAQKGLRLQVCVDRAASARADRTALHRILHNLVGNAIKFTDEGHVRVRLGASGSETTVTVEDTGRGIDKGSLPHLFEAFWQESDGLSRSHEGTGLGLSLSKQLAEQMGGAITAESEKGCGSVFTLHLPGCEDVLEMQGGTGRSASQSPALQQTYSEAL